MRDYPGHLPGDPDGDGDDVSDDGALDGEPSGEPEVVGEPLLTGAGVEGVLVVGAPPGIGLAGVPGVTWSHGLADLVGS